VNIAPISLRLSNWQSEYINGSMAGEELAGGIIITVSFDGIKYYVLYQIVRF